MVGGSGLVEVIEDGRIVRVSEEYAIREGLPILRKLETKESIGLTTFQSHNPTHQGARKKRSILDLDKFRKPLRYEENNVIADLIPNFQWEISKKRRSMNMTRKQLANAIGESESSIQMIENGVLPSDDFILVNKLQEYLKINLRKDGGNFIDSPRKMIEARPKEETKTANGKKKTLSSDISGDEIEIFDD